MPARTKAVRSTPATLAAILRAEISLMRQPISPSSASCSWVRVRILDDIGAVHAAGFSRGAPSGRSLGSRVVPRTPDPEFAVKTSLAHRFCAAVWMNVFLAFAPIWPRASTFAATPVARTFEYRKQELAAEGVTVPALECFVAQRVVEVLESAIENRSFGWHVVVRVRRHGHQRAVQIFVNVQSGMIRD